MMRSALLALLLLGACQKASSPAADLPLLAHAPANTPYAFAMLEPFPRVYWDKLGSFAGDIEKLIEKEQAEAGESDKIGKALWQELKGNFNEAGVRKLFGVGPGARILVYGIGFYPVVRIELEDDKALPATVERFTKAAGLTNPLATHEGRTYWRIEEDDVVFVAAVADRQLVLAGGPKAGFDTEILPNVLGMAKPEKSLLVSGTFPSLIAKHKLGPWTGYLDTAMLLEKARSKVALECGLALSGATQIVPRVVLGYDRWNGGVLSGRMIVELEEGLAGKLMELVVEVPGFSDGKLKEPGLLAFGGGVHLEKGRLLLLNGARALAAIGTVCEPGLAREAQEFADAVARPLPPGIDALQGFVINLMSAKVAPDGIGDVDGYAIVGTTDVNKVLTPLAGLLSIPADKLPRDGKFQEIFPAGTLPMVGPLQATVEGNSILVATGAGGPAGAKRALANKGPAPLFYMAYDYATIMKLTMFGTSPPTTSSAPYELYRRIIDMMGLVTFSVQPTKAGLVCETTMTFR
jgi:hypothetical protein